MKKVVELIPCPKCNKMMSQKSLRYTHEKNCKGEVVDTQDLPVKRRVKKEVNKEVNNEVNTQEKQIKSNNTNNDEYEIPQNIKEEICRVIARQQLKFKMKEDNLNKLKQNIA